MNKSEKDEQVDSDILKSRQDILRARDIIPPYKKETAQQAEFKEADEQETPCPKTSEEEESPDEKTVEPVETRPSDDRRACAGARQETAEIPKFDLAEDIMAEQRRITAVRRKAPDKKVEPAVPEKETQPISHFFEEPKPAEHKDRIIANIVARDIEKLCRGESLADN